MQFQLVICDEIDVGILHEILLHLIRDHPPVQMNVVVEFDSNGCTWIDSTSTCSPDPIPSSTNELPQNTDGGQPERSEGNNFTPDPKDSINPNAEQDQPEEPKSEL